MVPDFLTHYYDCERGPFRNLSDLPLEEAQAIMSAFRQKRDSFASRRQHDYMEIRFDLEDRVRAQFMAKGGRPVRARPHYMLLGACDWVRSWYPRGCEVQIPLADFTPDQVSFTYGDIFPAMRFPDGKPYRRQVYTLAELPDLITVYGLPQDWNPDGSLGPDRYIEAQVWDDAPLRRWLSRANQTQPPSVT